MFFFFQAEDGIRDIGVTGVQTCALPISLFHGHVLLVPRTHVETLADLPADQVGTLFAVVQRLSRAVPAAMDAQGSFVAINNIVSQSVPHLHVHVVPRRRKDGLRGFFWPRTKYDSGDQMAAVAERIRAM